MRLEMAEYPVREIRLAGAHRYRDGTPLYPPGDSRNEPGESRNDEEQS